MQKQHHNEERQPFLKPLSGNTNSSPFVSLSQSQSIDIPNKENEYLDLDQSSSNRLASLHTKLHNEADKIRKWKNQTETEIKQRDRKILERGHIIETLRKNVLELQLANENLQTTLQEECANREEIGQRIDATREMVNLLKNFSSKVETSLIDTETEGTSLKNKMTEQQNKYENLTNAFKSLEISSEKRIHEVEHELNTERQMKTEIEHQLRNNLTKAEKQLQTLKSLCDKKDADIDKQCVSLHEKLKTNEQLQNEYRTLQMTLDNVSQTAIETKQTLDEKITELNSNKEMSAQLECRLGETINKLQETIENRDKLAQNFDQTEQKYVSNIRSLQEDISCMSKVYDEQKQRILELEQELDKTNNTLEELKCSKDMLLLERTETRERIQIYEREKNILENQFEDLKTQILEMQQQHGELKTDMDSLTKIHQQLQLNMEAAEANISEKRNTIKVMDINIEKLMQEIKSQQDCEDQFRAELQDALGRETSALETIENIKQQLELKSCENISRTEHLDEITQHNKELQKELNATKKEVSKLKKDIEKSKNKESTTKEKLESSISEMKSLRTELENLKKISEVKEGEVETKLCEELKMNISLKSELEKKTKTLTDLDSKNKDLRKENTTKTKEVKELNKQMEKLEATARTAMENKEASVRHTDAKMADMMKILDKYKLDMQKVVCDKDRELDAVNEQLAAMADKMEKLEATARTAMENKEASVRHTDAKVADMMQILDKYKLDMQKVVCDKDRELDAVNEQLAAMADKTKHLGELEKSNCDKDGMLEALRKEKESEMQHVQQSLEQLRTKYQSECQIKDSLKSTIDTLKRVSEEQKEIIQRLEREVSDWKEKATTAPQQPTAETKSRSSSQSARHQASKVEQSLHPLPTASLCSTPTSAPRNTATPRQSAAIVPNIRVATTPTVAALTLEDDDSSDVSSEQGMIVMTSGYKTPQRSILKQAIPSSKKRRVMFASDKESDSEDSSSSELMEIDVDVDTIPSGRIKNTPLMLRPSPMYKSPGRDSARHLTATTTLKPVPRGLPTRSPLPTSDTNTKKARKQHGEKKREHSFPVTSSQQMCEPSGESKIKKKANALKQAANIRQTCDKSPGKFFRPSIKENKQKQKEDVNWFEADTVFGFGPED